MGIVDVSRVRKRFLIPRMHRTTIREHVLDLFRPQPVEELVVLDDVSFEVRGGETLGIMGRNGSGKSTLLKIIAGIYQPDGGAVRANAGLTPLLELGVGWNPELDAIDNIMLLGSVMGLTLVELRRSTDQILAFAELERFANQKLQHYSSGMASRLAYAVAFRAVREILVLDEIFAVGDAGFRKRCAQRYAELKAAGHTIIMVSHDPKIIEAFCERAILLEGGRILAAGSGPDVAAQYLSLLERPARAGRPELVPADGCE
jgi:ABC-2 type transport system ATP-binding protein